MVEKRFPDETWEKIASIVASVFAMDKSRKERLLDNPTAKLIAAIPFLAGCYESERTAIAHVATYVIAGSDAAEAVFDHKAGDNYDVLARLASIGQFEGGNPAIINRGMKLLAKIMIEGYRRDIDSDKAAGKYNPLGQGAWNASEKLSSLESSIATTSDEEMDSIAVGASIAASWWRKPS
jgi:hypothetical protein